MLGIIDGCGLFGLLDGESLVARTSKIHANNFFSSVVRIYVRYHGLGIHDIKEQRMQVGLPGWRSGGALLELRAMNPIPRFSTCVRLSSANERPHLSICVLPLASMG